MKTWIKEGYSAVLAITRTFAAQNRTVLQTSKHLQEVGIILFITGCPFKIIQPQRKRTVYKNLWLDSLHFLLNIFLIVTMKQKYWQIFSFTWWHTSECNRLLNNKKHKVVGSICQLLTEFWDDSVAPKNEWEPLVDCGWLDLKIILLQK